MGVAGYTFFCKIRASTGSCIPLHLYLCVASHMIALGFFINVSALFVINPDQCDKYFVKVPL